MDHIASCAPVNKTERRAIEVQRKADRASRGVNHVIALRSSRLTLANTTITMKGPQRPNIGTALAMSAKRYDGSSGTAVFSGPATFQEGQMSAANLSNISIWEGATERAITVVDSNLRHPDGSVKVAFIHTSISAANETEVPLTLELTTPPSAGSVTAATINAAWMLAPRLLGCTDADHLCKSHVALGPLVPIAELTSQGLTQWVTALTTEFEATDNDFPCYGNPKADFDASTSASWPNKGGEGATYDVVYPMYCKYLCTGEIDDLRYANGFSAWSETNLPNNTQRQSHANGTLKDASDNSNYPVNPDYADPPSGSTSSPLGLTEWFSGHARDFYMGWALGGWQQAKGAGLAWGVRNCIAEAVGTQFNPSQWGGRFDWRYIREFGNYVPLYNEDIAFDYSSGAAGSVVSPVSNWSTWETMYQTHWYNKFDTWPQFFSGDSIGRDDIWGHGNFDPLSNGGYVPTFQFITVFNTIYTLEQNVYQDSLGRTWTELENLADWLEGRTNGPYTITWGPANGVDTYVCNYDASGSVPTGLNADGPYSCAMIMPIMAWAYAKTGLQKYLDFIDTMNTNRVWVVNNAGSAGNGWKQLGEHFGMIYHAAAWRAGVAHNGWDL